MRGWTLPVTRGSAIAAVVALLALRTLSLVSVYFFEEDEVSLAVGVAALVAGTPGHMYRYAVQLGYYRFIEAVTLLSGGSIALVPWIMKGASAVAGTALPVAGWFMFQRELPPIQRLTVALVLAINPAIWQSARYGNTAIVSAALGACALAALSNPVGRAARLAALGGLAAAVLMRGDAALLWPVALVLIARTTGSWKTALGEVVMVGTALTALYAGLLLVDPRMDNATAAVSRHMSDTPNPSMFWEYWLWALSPAAAVFTVWGARRLLDTNPQLLGVLCVWALPTLLFYFRATTTTRYFVNVGAPLAVLSAVGMADAARLARRWLPRRLACGLIGAAASVHLVLALGHVPPTRPLEYFYGGTFQTHDGPMPTGALLARSLLTSGSLARSLPAPAFGRQSYPFWEGPAFAAAVARLPALPPDRAVVILLSSGFGHGFHYHAHAAGARYENGPGNADDLWGDGLRLWLGGTRVFTIGDRSAAYAALATFAVAPGDELWAMEGVNLTAADVGAKLPPGLTLRATAPFDEHFQTFAVVHGEAPGH